MRVVRLDIHRIFPGARTWRTASPGGLGRAGHDVRSFRRTRLDTDP
jgi:hypothetical protein